MNRCDFLAGNVLSSNHGDHSVGRGYWLNSIIGSFLSMVAGTTIVDRVELVFLLCGALAIGISHLRPVAQAGAVDLSEVSFKTSVVSI